MLHKRCEHGKHHHHARAGTEEQHEVDPDHPRNGEQRNEGAEGQLNQQKRASHPVGTSTPGHYQRAADRTDASAGHELRVLADAPTEDILGEHGQERQERRAEKRCRERQDSEPHEARLVPHIGQTTTELGAHAAAGRWHMADVQRQ